MANYANFNFSQNEPILIPGLPYELGLECLLRVPIISHPTLKLVSHSWKSTVSDSSFYFERLRLSFSEHLLFLIQPLSPSSPDQPGTTKNCDNTQPPIYNLNIYNLNRSEWQRLSLPVPIFAQCVAVPTAAKLVVLGGWDPSTLEPVNRVLVFDLVTGTWQEGSPMPTARSFFAAVASTSTNTVYVAGGHDGQKNALLSAEAYDVVSHTWWALPAMSEERDESHGLSFDGSKFWVISGYGTESQGRFRSDAEVFDPQTQTWSTIEGVWPYPSTTPKSTTVLGKQRERWVIVVDGQLREFDWEEKRWKVSNSGRVPDQISGSSSVSLIDIGEGDNKEGIFAMGSGGNCGEWCGGEGVFILERGNEDVKETKWKHVHAPSMFLGLPFSTSHMLI